ncbi:MAG: hemagglutinin repeat-containing protein [Pseudomonadota bacterium]
MLGTGNLESDLFASRDVTISSNVFDVAVGANIRADRNLTFSGALSNGGIISAGGSLDVLSDNFSQTADGFLFSSGDLRLDIGNDLTVTDRFGSEASIFLTAENVLVESGLTFASSQTASLTAREQLTINGTVAGSDVVLDGGDIVISAAALVSAGNSIELGGGDVDVFGTLATDGIVRLTGNNLLVAGGVSIAGNRVEGTLSGSIDLNGIIGADTINLEAESLDIAVGGLLTGTSSVALDLTGTLVQSGELSSGGALNVSAGSLILPEVVTDIDGTIISGAILANSIDFDVSSSAQIDGLVQTGGGSFDAAQLILSQTGFVGSTGNIALAGSQINLAGAVVSSGDAALTGGSLNILSTAEIQAANNLSLSGAITQNSDLFAGNDFIISGSIFTQGNGQVLAAARDITLGQSGSVQINGIVEAGRNVSLSGNAFGQSTNAVIFGSNAVSIQGNSSLDISGQVGGNSIALNGVNLVLGNNAEIIASNTLTGNLTGNSTVAGLLASNGSLTLSGGNLTIDGPGVVSALGTGTLDFANLDLSGALTANVLSVQGGNLDVLSGGALIGSNSLSIDVTGQVTNASDIISGSVISISSGSLNNSSTGLIQAAGNLTATINGSLLQSGNIVSGGNLSLQVGSLANTTSGFIGTFGSSGSVSISSTGDIQQNGQIGGNSVSIIGRDIINGANALIISDGTLNLTANGFLENLGTLQADSELSISAAQLENAGGGILNGGSISANIAGALTNRNIIAADGAIALTAGSFTNTAGSVVSAGNSGASTLDLNISGRLTNSGDLVASGNFDFDGGEFVQTASGDSGGNAITIDTNGLVDIAGRVVSDSNISIETQNGNIFNRGLLSASGLTEIIARNGLQFENVAGGQIGAADLNIAAGATRNRGLIDVADDFGTFTGSLTNNGVLVVGDRSNLIGGAFSNTGTFVTGGALDLVGTATLSNSGTVFVDGAFSSVLSGLTITNSGTFTIDSNASINIAGLNNSGLFEATRLTLQTTSSLTNNGTLLGQDALSITSGGNIINNGDIQSNGLVTLNARAFRNSAGSGLLGGSIRVSLPEVAQSLRGITQGGGNPFTTLGSLTPSTSAIRSFVIQNIDGFLFSTLEPFLDVNSFIGLPNGPLDFSVSCGSFSCMIRIDGFLVFPGEPETLRFQNVPISVLVDAAESVGVILGNSFTPAQTNNDPIPRLQSFSGGNLPGLANGDFQNAGGIIAAGDFDLNGTRLINTGILAATSLTADLTGAFDARADSVGGVSSIDITARQLVGAGFDSLVANQNLSVEVLEGDIVLSDSLGVRGSLRLEAPGDIVVSSTSGALNGVVLVAGDDVLVTNSGTLLSGGSTTLSAGNLVVNRGTVQALQNITINGSGFENGAGAAVQARGGVFNSAAGSTVNLGVVSGSVVQISSTSITNGLNGTLRPPTGTLAPPAERTGSEPNAGDVAGANINGQGIGTQTSVGNVFPQGFSNATGQTPINDPATSGGGNVSQTTVNSRGFQADQGQPNNLGGLAPPTQMAATFVNAIGDLTSGDQGLSSTSLLNLQLENNSPTVSDISQTNIALSPPTAITADALPDANNGSDLAGIAVAATTSAAAPLAGLAGTVSSTPSQPVEVDIEGIQQILLDGADAPTPAAILESINIDSLTDGLATLVLSSGALPVFAEGASFTAAELTISLAALDALTLDAILIEAGISPAEFSQIQAEPVLLQAFAAALGVNLAVAPEATFNSLTNSTEIPAAAGPQLIGLPQVSISAPPQIVFDPSTSTFVGVAPVDTNTLSAGEDFNFDDFQSVRDLFGAFGITTEEVSFDSITDAFEDNVATISPYNAAIIGDQVLLSADFVRNSGVISGSQLAVLNVGEFNNIDGEIFGEQIAINARDDLANQFGDIIGGTVDINSAGDVLNNVGNIIADNGDLLITSVGDIFNLNASRINSDGDLSVIAGGDIINEALTFQFRLGEEHGCGGRACGSLADDFLASEIAAGGNLLFSAQGDIINRASNIGAVDDATLFATGDIRNEALTSVFTIVDINRRRGLFGREIVREEAAIIRGSTIQSGGDLIASADGDIVSEGSLFASNGLSALDARGDVILDAVIEELEFFERRRGFSGLSFQSVRRERNDFALEISQVIGEDVSIFADGDIEGSAAIVAAARDLTAAAGGDITFEAETLERFFEERGFSVGVSFGGSSLLESVINGGSFSDVGGAFLQSNPFTSSLQRLAGSDTPFEIGFNALNSVTRGLDFTREALTSENGQGLVGQLNPFATQGDPTNLNPLQSIASGVTFDFSSFRNEQQFTESISSQIEAGRDLILSAGGDINLTGGTEAFAGRDALIEATGDILLQAAEDTLRERSRSFGGSFGINPQGFSVGFNTQNGRTDALTFTPTSVTVGANLNLSSGGDTSLIGAQIGANTANLDIGGDLLVETLQNLTEARQRGGGLSVTIGPVLGGSANVNASRQDRAFSDDVSSIITNGALDIDVGGTTSLIGGTIGSRTDDFRLSTEELITEDLADTDSSRSFSLSVSNAPNEAGPNLSSFSGIGGSFSSSVTEGETFATLGRGEITIGGDRVEEGDLAGLNRDLDANQIITRDTNFDTGDLELDIGALARAQENLQIIEQEVVRHVILNFTEDGRILRDIANLTNETLDTFIEDGLLEGPVDGARLSGVLQSILGGIEDPSNTEAIRADLEAALVVSPGLRAYLSGEDTPLDSVFASVFRGSDALTTFFQPSANQFAALQDAVADLPLEQQFRFVAATCALTSCAESVPSSDPFHDYLTQLQDAGGNFGDELAILSATGEFDRGFLRRAFDGFSDLVGRNEGRIETASEAGQVVGGAAGVVSGFVIAGGGGAAGGVACAPTAGAGCAAGTGAFVLGAGIATTSYAAASDASARLLIPFESTEGARIFATLTNTLDPDGQHPGQDGPVGRQSVGVGLIALEATLGRLALGPSLRSDGSGFSIFPGRRVEDVAGSEIRARSEDFTPPTNQFSDTELQGAADRLHSLNPRGESVITVTQTPNGRVIVSSNNQVPTQAQIIEAKRLFGDDVEIVRGTTRTNAPGPTGSHAEQRGIQQAGEDAAGSRQASSHNSCDGCVQAQSEAGVTNVTGAAEDNGGVFSRPRDPSKAPDPED